MKHVDKAAEKIALLKTKLHEAESIDDLKTEGLYLRKEVFPLLDVIREDVDALELILPRDVYPLPAYLELLFLLD
jgi:glutamine synthetase